MARNENSMRISIKTRYFLSHFLAVALVSGSIGTYFYLSAVDSVLDNLKTRLMNTAAMAALSVDVTALDAVQNPDDMGLPAYTATLATLRRLTASNPDIAYLYVMRRDGDGVRFVVDSDESDRQAPPGRAYPDAPAPLLAGFEAASVDDRLYEDAWGVFMSGYAPLGGSGDAYLLGIDMRDTEVGRKLRNLRISGLVSLGLSLGLAFVFATVLARRINSSLRLFVDACAAVAEGRGGARVDVRTGDELERLAAAINDMSERLEENEARRAEAEAEIMRSRDDLEARVRERTGELSRLNGLLMHEIEERKRAEEALYQAAMTDSLTGLPNRRAMERHLEAQAARVSRGGKPFSVLLCDLDRFKSVNDAFGHEAGDEFLRATARVLKAAVRVGDMVCRWGGEEFLVLLADTDLEGALAAAGKLCRAMEELRVPVGEFMVTRSISIGVSVCEDCRNLDEVLRLADEALYSAKDLGRNRVSAQGPHGENSGPA